jgi:hypothetical protein
MNEYNQAKRVGCGMLMEKLIAIILANITHCILIAGYFLHWFS